jgi:hypothetical protein
MRETILAPNLEKFKILCPDLVADWSRASTMWESPAAARRLPHETGSGAGASAFGTAGAARELSGNIYDTAWEVLIIIITQSRGHAAEGNSGNASIFAPAHNPKPHLLAGTDGYTTGAGHVGNFFHMHQRADEK